MDSNSLNVKVIKNRTRDVLNAPSSQNELLSVIWEAAESLTSQDLMSRVSGFEQLVEFDAIRQLPLITYLVCTRLVEPDIELRTRIVKTLAGLTNMTGPDGGGIARVQDTLIACLSGLRTREVFALLQIALYDKNAEQYITDLLSWCSFAGNHLSQILSNRNAPLEIRRQAAHFIGLIGYLDALPVLQKLASRFESRGDEDYSSILPVLQNAVLLLSAP